MEVSYPDLSEQKIIEIQIKSFIFQLSFYIMFHIYLDI